MTSHPITSRYGGINMKASTYKNIINLISDPDTMTDGISKLQAQLEIDEEDYNK